MGDEDLLNEPTNPAGRIENFLLELSKQRHEGGVQEAIANVTGFPWPVDWPLTMRLAASLRDAWNEVDGWSDAHPTRQRELHKAGLAQSRDVLDRFPMVGAGHQLQWFLEGFDGVGRLALSYFTAEMEDYEPSRRLTEGKVTDLLERIAELRDDVGKAEDLSYQTKQEVEGHLNHIEETLRLLPFVGAEGVQDALNQAYGAIALPTPLSFRLRTSPIFKTIIAVFLVVNETLSAASNIKELTSGPEPMPPIAITVNVAGMDPFELPERPHREIPAATSIELDDPAEH